MGKQLHLLKPGTFTDNSGATVTFGNNDLQRIAANYSPAAHEAPIVVGHPRDDAPAYGWIQSLSYDDTGLHAAPTDVDAQFADLVREGRYKKISVALYTPTHPNNPTDDWYLKHVGFLGAKAPAVKGLRNAQLADEADDTVIETTLSSPAETNFGHVYSHLNLQYIGGNKMPPEEDTAKREAAFAEREASLKQKQDELEKLELELAETQERIRRVEVEKTINAHIDAGRVLPGDKPGLVALAEAALSAEDAEGAVIAFADADGKEQKTPLSKWLNGFIGRLPVQVDFAERAASNKSSTASTQSVSVPAGYQMDLGQAEIHRQAMEYAESNQCDYVTAVLAVDQRTGGAI